MLFARLCRIMSSLSRIRYLKSKPKSLLGICYNVYVSTMFQWISLYLNQLRISADYFFLYKTFRSKLLLYTKAWVSSAYNKLSFHWSRRGIGFLNFFTPLPVLRMSISDRCINFFQILSKLGWNLFQFHWGNKYLLIVSINFFRISDRLRDTKALNYFFMTKQLISTDLLQFLGNKIKFYRKLINS